MRVTSPLRLGLAAACAVGLAGCRTIFPGPSQDEVGSTHLSVISVAPWHQVRDSLSPAFELTASSALALVAPSTLESQLTSRETTSARISFGPGLGRSAAGGGANAGSAPSSQGAQGGQPPEPAVTAALVAQNRIDPMLQYSAAMSLLQEVRLLDRHAVDAVKRHGYRRYVVRLQLSVLPLARDRTYDTYMNLTFLPVQRDSATLDFSALRSTEPVDLFAVPIFATDNVEAAEILRNTDRAGDYGINGGFGNVVESAGRTSSLGQSTGGKDLNSLLTVTRLTDNSIRVRIGARYSPTGYVMTPQNHYVTVLLMVPDWMARKADDWEVQVLSDAQFVDGGRGVALLPRDFSAVLRETAKIYDGLRPFLGDCDGDACQGGREKRRADVAFMAKSLLSWARRNRYREFASAAKERWPKFHGQPALFSRLLRIIPGGPAESASFQLPEVTGGDAQLPDRPEPAPPKPAPGAGKAPRRVAGKAAGQKPQP